MELRDFVSETIIDIVRGVEAAQRGVGHMGALVNPGTLDFGSAPNFDPSTRTFSRQIEFDVAVTASQGSSTGGGGGVQVAFLRAGLEAEERDEHTSVSRIRFSVPVILPEHSQTMERASRDR